LGPTAAPPQPSNTTPIIKNKRTPAPRTRNRRMYPPPQSDSGAPISRVGRLPSGGFVSLEADDCFGNSRLGLTKLVRQPYARAFLASRTRRLVHRLSDVYLPRQPPRSARG